MATLNLLSILLLNLICGSVLANREKFIDDICAHITGQRIYLEFSESGSLTAKYNNNAFDKLKIHRNETQNRCTVEFVTCPSCIIAIKFRLLNISRNCEKTTVFDTCSCDYVWIYEPQFEQVSGDQFCGLFVKNNGSELNYRSQTRRVAVSFLYSQNYGHAFTLDYFSDRNRMFLTGHPKSGNLNNGSQTISSPFFPNFYPTDLIMEQVINCESPRTCRISLVFTDFQLTDSSIIEFFDWNGQRIYVTTGNIFRPPVIITTGPSLVIRFYANGASNLGYKASYSFILGDLNESHFKPNIDCGGPVNNLGGGITMMDMLTEGSQLFDCLWLIKPPGSYTHMKTHLYVKVVTFSNFAGNTEITIRQGLTSSGPLVEDLRLPLAHFYSLKAKEQVVPITQGFYVSLKGLFRPDSHLVIVYAAFNYKDCFAGSDFLCHNLRCISNLLHCDGFDHCGDNSDELPSICSKEPRDRREWSKTPNFLFPKVDGYSDLTTATLVFLSCSFGLIGLILALAVLLYRMNLKARHQRQIQNHIETIHAILEEGVGEIEEEIIIADDPPDYEPPPEYKDVVMKKKIGSKNLVVYNSKISKKAMCSKCNNNLLPSTCSDDVDDGGDEASSVGAFSGVKDARRIPDSPPPAYYCTKQENAISSGAGTCDESVGSSVINVEIFDSPVDDAVGAGPSSIEYHSIIEKTRRHSESDLIALITNTSSSTVQFVKSFSSDYLDLKA